jgi:predicted N-acyltransferase
MRSNLSITVYDTIQEVNSGQWNHVVTQSGRGSVYHRYEWIKSVEEGLGLTGKHTVVSKKGNPIAVFPNFLTNVRLPGEVERKLPDSLLAQISELSSLRPGYGGPVIQTNESEVLELFLERLEKTGGKKTISHYLRSASLENVRYANRLEQEGYKPNVSRCKIILDVTQDIDDIRSSMDKGRRQNIRKAKNNDPKVYSEELSEKSLEEFYRGYEATMDRVESDPYPFNFFEELAENLRDSLLLVAVDVDGETVGRHLCVVDDIQRTVSYEFASVFEDNFEYYPSDLIHEFTIKWCREEGYDEYDLGPTPSDFNDGLFSYKEQYGGEVVPILIWERGTSPLWSMYKIMRSVYKRL